MENQPSDKMKNFLSRKKDYPGAFSILIPTKDLVTKKNKKSTIISSTLLAFEYFKKNNPKNKEFFEIIFDDFFGKFINLLTRLASNLLTRAVDAAGNVIYKIKNLFTDGKNIAGMTAKGGAIASKYMTSGYGWRWGKMHNGVDIAGGPWVQGVEMSVIKPGVVVDLDDLGPKGWGKFVVIKHDDGYYSLYGHMDSIAVSKGQRIENKDGAATVIGTMGTTGASKGPHLHFELGTGWNGGVITGHMNPLPHIDKFVRAGGDVTVEKLEEVAKSAAPTGEYDIIIPLDHVPGNLSGKFPDDDAKTSFKQSKSTGADGRERQAQDPAAAKLKAKLEAKGYKVAIVKPESYSSYEAYDKYIEKQSKKGVRIIPLHFDAIRSAKGTGFLTRTRADDAEDAAFAAPIQKALENFQKNNKNLGNISSDTQDNATVNRGAASPTALIELGVQVDWEKHYGKNFTQSKKFDELIQGVADAIETVAPKRKKTPPPAPKPPIKPRRNRRGRIISSALTTSPENTQTQTAQQIAKSYDTDETIQVIAMAKSQSNVQKQSKQTEQIKYETPENEIDNLIDYATTRSVFNLGTAA